MLCSHRTQSKIFARPSINANTHICANESFQLKRKMCVTLCRKSWSMKRCQWRFRRNGVQEYCSCLWTSSVKRHYFVFVYGSHFGHGWRGASRCPGDNEWMSWTVQHRLWDDSGTIDHNKIKCIHQWFNTLNTRHVKHIITFSSILKFHKLWTIYSHYRCCCVLYSALRYVVWKYFFKRWTFQNFL